MLEISLRELRQSEPPLRQDCVTAALLHSNHNAPISDVGPVHILGDDLLSLSHVSSSIEKFKGVVIETEASQTIAHQLCRIVVMREKDARTVGDLFPQAQANDASSARTTDIPVFENGAGVAPFADCRHDGFVRFASKGLVRCVE